MRTLVFRSLKSTHSNPYPNSTITNFSASGDYRIRHQSPCPWNFMQFEVESLIGVIFARSNNIILQNKVKTKNKHITFFLLFLLLLLGNIGSLCFSKAIWFGFGILNPLKEAIKENNTMLIQWSHFLSGVIGRRTRRKKRLEKQRSM